MSDFETKVNIFARKVDDEARKVLAGTVDKILVSVRDGDPVTGSPGQPVDLGDLKRSWQSTVEGNEGHVFSDDPAARVIEAGVRAGTPLQFRSGGGAHSVKLTVNAADKLVEATVREVRSA